MRGVQSGLGGTLRGEVRGERGVGTLAGVGVCVGGMYVGAGGLN